MRALLLAIVIECALLRGCSAETRQSGMMQPTTLSQQAFSSLLGGQHNRFGSPGPWVAAMRKATSIGAFTPPPNATLPFEALIVFPCASSACTSVARNPNDSSGRWPVLAFGIGYQSWPQRYDETLHHLASHGFIIVAPDAVDRMPVPRIWEYAQVVVLSLAWLGEQSANPGSFLASRVDINRCGAFGHSMGAGTALVVSALSSNVPWARSLGTGALAPGEWTWGPATLLFSRPFASVWPRVRAVMTLGLVPVTAPITALQHNNAPTFFLAAEADRFAPPARQKELFASVRASPRMMAVLRAGTHCWLDADESGYPVSQCGQARAQRNLLLPETQLFASRKLLVAYFLAVLCQDGEAQAFISVDRLRRDNSFSEVLSETR